MTTDTAATAFAILSLFVCVSAALGAAPQQPATVPAVSVERIREGLDKKPALKLDVKGQLPVATFKTSVEQRMYTLTLEGQLRKDFTLTPLQQQSADWASKCCGLDLGQLVTPIEKALRRRKERQVREQVARERAAVEAAWQKRVALSGR